MRFRRARPVAAAEAVTVVDEGLPPGAVVEEEVAPPPPPPEPPPRPLLWPWLLLLLALVIGGLVAAWLLTRDNGHKGASTVNVPNVVRLKQREAVQRLNARGLIARMTTRASTAAPGTVVAQDPNPGADVVRHSVVTLTVSAVQNEAVPNVVGEQEAAAVSTLQSRRLPGADGQRGLDEADGDGARAEPAVRCSGGARLDGDDSRLARARDGARTRSASRAPTPLRRFAAPG